MAQAISDYLIPKPALCNRLIVLRCSPHWTGSGRRALVLCWPVCIKDKKYDRNMLIFTLGFVLYDDAETVPGTAAAAAAAAAALAAPPPSSEGEERPAWDLEACDRYGPVLRKASEYLETLETECGMLSDPVQKGELGRILPQLLHGLQVSPNC